METTQKTEKVAKPKPPKIVVATGKRKTSVARATVKQGKGAIRVNSVPLKQIKPDLVRLKIEEPLRIAGDVVKEVDIDVRVESGGFVSQAGAARQAVARGLVEWARSPTLRNVFIAYDRSLLVADPRQTEPHKFSRSSKGARRRKQLSRR